MNKETVQNAIALLEKAETLPAMTSSIGFDAVVDTLVAPVKTLGDGGKKEYFTTIEEFGSYLVGKKGLSCVIELEEKLEKPGGNMINLAHALGTLGLRTDIVGSVGTPIINPIFDALSPNCRLHGVAEPGRCTGLEFNDGKVMLSHMDNPNEMTFASIKSRLGTARLTEVFAGADLAGLVNWSELKNGTEIWRGILNEILIPAGADKNKWTLFDITDCTRHGDMQINEILEIINGFARVRKTVVSLNQNEAERISGALGCNPQAVSAKTLAKEIFDHMRVDMVVVHPVSGSCGVTAEGAFTSPGFFVAEPAISTGGGDNYNAGLCFGLLYTRDVPTALLLADAVAGCYVRCAHSPDRAELLKFLREEGLQ